MQTKNSMGLCSLYCMHIPTSKDEHFFASRHQINVVDGPMLLQFTEILLGMLQVWPW